MGATVFANGMSIACKVASGKTIAAMPDVCLSPPSPPAGPVPLPYPNTAAASDTDQGSKTVQIGGEPVMLKDKSVFKTSTGNEAATKSFGMSVITHQIQGKASFVAWSMDVKFEGENVPRHLDLMGQNEASSPPSPPPWLYTDSMSVNGVTDPCKETRENVQDNCSGDDNCKDPCKSASRCVLVPYKQGCCDGKTPHHVIPAHCFMPPGVRAVNGPERYEDCASYQPDDAPCVCVTGKDKSNKRKQHARIHKHFDALEDLAKDLTQEVDGEAGTWSYDNAADAGAESVAKVMKCNEECTRAQLDNYHGSKGIGPNTQLRASSSGQGGSPESLNIVTPVGAIG